MPAGGCFANALSASGSAIAPGHIRSHTTFIQKNEAIGGNPSNQFPPCTSLGLPSLGILLSGVQAFFSCACPFPAVQPTISAH